MTLAGGIKAISPIPGEGSRVLSGIRLKAMPQPRPALEEPGAASESSRDGSGSDARTSGRTSL